MTKLCDLMDVHALLEKVRELFEEPSRWTQGALARDARGEVVLPDAPTACSWCLIGACFKIGGLWFLASDTIRAWLVSQGEGSGNIATWNDRETTSVVEVRRMLDTLLASLPSYLPPAS